MIDSKTAVGVKIKRAFLIINLQNIITGLIRVGFTNDEIPNNKPGHVNLGKVEHIKDAIFYLQGSGIKTVAATEKTDQNIYDINLKEAVAIIMGSEDRGINPSVLKIVDEKAKLPMFGSIGSLNVSVASGAFLYEVVRQRS